MNDCIIHKQQCLRPQFPLFSKMLIEEVCRSFKFLRKVNWFRSWSEVSIHYSLFKMQVPSRGKSFLRFSNFLSRFTFNFVLTWASLTQFEGNDSRIWSTKFALRFANSLKQSWASTMPFHLILTFSWLIVSAIKLHR